MKLIQKCELLIIINIIMKSNDYRMNKSNSIDAVLLKVRLHMYQYRYNPSAMNIKQNTIHTATIP